MVDKKRKVQFITKKAKLTIISLVFVFNLFIFPGISKAIPAPPGGTPITITANDITTADGTYQAGQDILITLTYSAAVNVAAGVPTLALNTTPARSAEYDSGSGSANLVFKYTVQSGDSAANLGATGTGAMSLNGATIKNIAGTVNATSTLLDDLTAGNAVVIDTSAPAESDDHGGKNQKLYKKYRLSYKKPAKKISYGQVKNLKKINTSEFERLKALYAQYRTAGKREIAKLSPKNQSDFKLYKSYRGHKLYRQFKKKLGK